MCSRPSMRSEKGTLWKQALIFVVGHTGLNASLAGEFRSLQIIALSMPENPSA